jgi:DNA-binding response OmpR family regulator
MSDINVLLLVEDDDNDIIITKRLISRSSIRVNTVRIAKTLAEGMAIIRDDNVNMVLLDLNLPDSRGLDTLVEMRKSFDGIVIVLTSLDDELIGIEAIKSGADDYLIKNQINDALLRRSIIYSIERKKVKDKLASMIPRIQELATIGKK